jgi:hypothetical protein
MATKRRKPSTALEQLHERLDRVTGDGTCAALILPLIGLAMKCVRPCGRCRALAAEVERLRPEWDRARGISARPRRDEAASDQGAAGPRLVHGRSPTLSQP